ncbi:hypothetical protein [Actinorhabdospora filicis]|uniref:hypothetical protein n=1 Tax=Actinorhabdospora filicis TaxID=1785913 RepID=UPI002552CA60|nr:hypothetical protein [Actinorhabdospora filicis]
MIDSTPVAGRGRPRALRIAIIAVAALVLLAGAAAVAAPRLTAHFEEQLRSLGLPAGWSVQKWAPYPLGVDATLTGPADPAPVRAWLSAAVGYEIDLGTSCSSGCHLSLGVGPDGAWDLQLDYFGERIEIDFAS